MSTKSWLKKYDPNVPTHISYPNYPLHDLLLASGEKCPSHICIRYGSIEYSYAETIDLVKNFASSLIGMGVKPGQRIGLVLPNTPEFVIAYYASLMVGAVVVPLNPAYTLSELDLQVRKTQITLVIGWQNRVELIRALASICDLQKIIICGGEYKKLTSAKSNQSSLVSELDSTEVSFNEMLGGGRSHLIFPTISASAPAVFQFSGGTTGTPKAAVALHKNIVANSLQFKAWLSTLEEGNEEFLTAIPLSHVYGMVIGLNVGIAMRATINLISDPRDIQEILETIQRNRITFFPGVPTMYHSINQNEKVKAGLFDLRTIKACISGSAPLLPEIRSQFEQLTGGKLVEGYGLSEAPTATHCNPIQGENRNGSIGIPLPDVDCEIAESGETSNGIGELLISGPQIMARYHNDDDETKLAIENGWLHTGDYARMDENGYFYLAGRKKDLIKVGGLQVWPREVEEAIARHPAVKEVVVAGIPDLARGERVKAWVVLNRGFEKVDPKEIEECCSKGIAHFKVPGEIEFIEAIPRTPVGKILRRELVKMEIKKETRE